MRDDMSKVVTERPRQGHGNKSKKTTGQRIRRYDPDREYVRASGGVVKSIESRYSLPSRHGRA